MTVAKQVKSKDEARGSQTKQWIHGLAGNATLFTLGVQSGWISPNIPVLQGPNSPSGYPLTDSQIGFIASSWCVTAVFSCMIYSFILDRYGRRAALIAVAVPQALAWILKLISADPYTIIISQCLVGFAGGGCTVAPIYAKEISQVSIRGAMGSLGLLLQGVGILVMYAMGAYMEYQTVLWILMVGPIVNALVLLKSPESPPYLVKWGRLEEAKETIASLYGREKDDKVVESVFCNLVSEQEHIDKMPKVSVKSIWSDKASRKACYLALLMIFVLDVGGNFAIITYASVIIANSGVTVEPELQSLSLPALMVVGSLLSTTTIEKFGRKPLFLTCLVATALTLAALATIILLQDTGVRVPGWISILSILISVFCYGAGILPIPFVVMSEIFSFQIRAKLLGATVCFGWAMCFVQAICFTPITRALGMFTVFYMFAGVNLVAAVLCVFLMPETKGRSLQEIEDKFRGG